jgi:hypothetical protein
MLVHSVAVRDDLQPASGVLGERVQHVVEELDVGRDLDRAAVEPEAQIDLRLARRALDEGVTVAQLRALPAGSRPRSAIGSNG